MIAKLLEGIPVLLQTEYRTLITSSEADDYGKILYTGMIDDFYDYCFGALEYRSLQFEEEVLPDCDNYQGNAMVNYTAEDIPYTRIIEHKHFEFGKGQGTVITREYPAAWEKGKEPYYPINNEENNALYQRYRALADKGEKVIFGGRLGQYQYFDMDKVIRSALDVASKEKNCNKKK